MHPTPSVPARDGHSVTLYAALELSHSVWLVTALSPGGEKMSKYTTAAGDDVASLWCMNRATPAPAY